MVRRPGGDEPERPGGRAAERLQEFLDQRGLSPEGSALDASRDDTGQGRSKRRNKGDLPVDPNAPAPPKTPRQRGRR